MALVSGWHLDLLKLFEDDSPIYLRYPQVWHMAWIANCSYSNSLRPIQGNIPILYSPKLHYYCLTTMTLWWSVIVHWGLFLTSTSIFVLLTDCNLCPMLLVWWASRTLILLWGYHRPSIWTLYKYFLDKQKQTPYVSWYSLMPMKNSLWFPIGRAIGLVQ